jgi:Raf kinase inhibitor-like YbhB/YbcL family protein
VGKMLKPTVIHVSLIVQMFKFQKNDNIKNSSSMSNNLTRCVMTKKTLLLMVLMGFSGLLHAAQTPFHLSSPAFKAHGEIPKKFSCQGENISPPLVWTKAAVEVKSYVLIMIDYDAKINLGHSVIHWVVYDIVPNMHYLTAGTQNIIVGLNTYDKKGYIGMCPDAGPEHHYYFDLYALDISHLDVPDFPTPEEVTKAMQNHIVAKTSMVATYQKQ